MRFLRWGAVVSLAGLLLVSAPPAQAKARLHVIVGLTYVPGTTRIPATTDTVKKGVTMSYVNLDPVAHTVTVIGVGINKLVPALGGRAGFSTSGLIVGHTYRYYCTIHGAAIQSGIFKVT